MAHQVKSAFFMWRWEVREEKVLPLERTAHRDAQLPFNGRCNAGQKCVRQVHDFGSALA